MRNQGLEGINVSPAPKPNPDGSYTITLSPDQWQTFQVNQSRPQSAPEPAAAGEMPEISASQDPSMSMSGVQDTTNPDYKIFNLFLISSTTSNYLFPI